MCVCVCVRVYVVSAGRVGYFALLRWTRPIPQGGLDRQKKKSSKEKVSVCVPPKREKVNIGNEGGGGMR